MSDLFSDPKNTIGLRMLWEVALGVRRNDLLGPAGQLAYFFLLSFFLLLIFLVSLVGLLIGDPEAGLRGLFEALTGFLPAGALTLVVDYIDRTLRTAGTGTLVLGILGALWLGQAASISITKAANLSYRLRGACLIITFGFTLLVTALTLAVFDLGAYASRLTGLPEAAAAAWGALRWVVVFATITLALDLLYYLAPDARLPQNAGKREVPDLPSRATRAWRRASRDPYEQEPTSPEGGRAEGVCTPPLGGRGDQSSTRTCGRFADESAGSQAVSGGPRALNGPFTVTWKSLIRIPRSGL